MKRVDIWWTKSKKRLKARLRMTNKRSAIEFYLAPNSEGSDCKYCPFNENPFCGRYKKNVRHPGICSMLWLFPGDNNFEGRLDISGWQIQGPIKRSRKIKNKKL